MGKPAVIAATRAMAIEWELNRIRGGIFVVNAWKRQFREPAPPAGTAEMAASIGALDPLEDRVHA